MPATSEEPISAIIPTVGRSDALERCLHSILRQTQRVAEVVIVHCGDDAETLAMAARRPSVRKLQITWKPICEIVTAILSLLKWQDGNTTIGLIGWWQERR
jgi:Glycosyl transferase family 2